MTMTSFAQKQLARSVFLDAAPLKRRLPLMVTSWPPAPVWRRTLRRPPPGLRSTRPSTNAEEAREERSEREVADSTASRYSSATSAFLLRARTAARPSWRPVTWERDPTETFAPPAADVFVDVLEEEDLEASAPERDEEWRGIVTGEKERKRKFGSVYGISTFNVTEGSGRGPPSRQLFPTKTEDGRRTEGERGGKGLR